MVAPAVIHEIDTICAPEKVPVEGVMTGVATVVVGDVMVITATLTGEFTFPLAKANARIVVVLLTKKLLVYNLVKLFRDSDGTFPFVV